MATPQFIRKYKVNPVEIAIFSVVSLIFLNSVYNLFYDNQGYQATALTPMAANPVSENAGRAPASIPQAFLNVEFKCSSLPDQETTAGKVRITGALCDPTGAAP